MNAYLVSAGNQLGITEFRGTSYQAEVLTHAMQCFGFLINSVALVRISFSAFADTIEANYDTGNLQTAETVRVLRELAVLNA